MGITRVTLTGTMFGQTIQNVMHFDNHDGGVSSGTFAGTILTTWLSEWKFLQHSGVKWTDIAVQRVSPAIEVAAHLPCNVDGTGNALTGADVPVVCYLIKLFTDHAGKHGRGRLYSPGPSAAHHDFGVVKASVLTTNQTRLNNIMAQYGGGSPPSGHTLVVWSRHSGDAAYPVIGMACKSTLATQRRRNYGVGV